MRTLPTLSVDRAHTKPYSDDVRRYYSITQVCRVLDGDRTPLDPVALQRGTDVHVIFALLIGAAAGWCHAPAIPAAYAGYAASIRAWMDQAKPQPVLIEAPSISSRKEYPYAGTPDVLARLLWRRRDTLALVEAKTGGPAPWHRVQVQAQADLIGYQEASVLLLLYLDRDGGLPTVTPVRRNAADRAAFHSALNVLRWRETA